MTNALLLHVAEKRKPPQHNKNPDRGAENADADGREKRVPHEAETEDIAENRKIRHEAPPIP